MGRNATLQDVHRAYRLILNRPADASGLAHYQARIASGLPVEALITELLASDEFRRATTTSVEVQAHALEEDTTDLITPASVLAQYSLEELNATAEEYYRRVTDIAPFLTKPFTFLNETPAILKNLGILLDGLHLGKSMTVLDFGGGTGWLTRLLAQLNCRTICTDVSPSALAIAQRLFADHPPLGPHVAPRFLVFDGHTLDVASESVDRIICFDAFHHVPNSADVIREFHRVLRPGGIVGFSEPGRFHSRSAQSQFEMKHHRVLENDIDLATIWAQARAVGFTAVDVALVVDGHVTLAQYESLVTGGADLAAADIVTERLRQTMTNQSIFFLRKGEAQPDSRSHEGLRHTLTATLTHVDRRSEHPVAHITVQATNTGTALWLCENDGIFGIVRVGTHLCAADGTLLDLDHSRHQLPEPVHPGDAVTLEIVVPLPTAGPSRLVVDLVAEGVTWFENAGSVACTLDVAG